MTFNVSLYTDSADSAAESGLVQDAISIDTDNF